MQRVLLVTDGSPNALRAARTAAQLAQRSRGEVLVIYVIPPVQILAKDTVSKGSAGLSTIVDALHDAMQMGQIALTQAANILTQARIAYTARLEQGIPATVIWQVSRSEPCNVIVIGSASLDRTTTLALGETSKRQNNCDSCAVIIVS